MDVRVINLDQAMAAKINVASAAYGLGSDEFIRASCHAALDELAARDKYLRAAFAMVDDAASADARAAREPVDA